MQSFTALFAALAILSPALGHMSLSYPPPLRAAINSNVPQNLVDYSITSPLSASGSNFPCKGYQADMGTAAGKATAEWTAGTQYNYTVLGSATHGGGSCQAALSYDKGVTWKVIHSYLGSCPLADGQNFDFTIPADAPSTGADGTLFSWSWYNVVGNREIYQSCASVSISGSKTRSAPAVAYSSRPDLFVANLANGCTTVEGKEVQFPDPGPDGDVTTKNSIADNSASYTGNCKAVDGVGGESGSRPASSSNNSAPIASGVSPISSIASSVSSIIASPLVTSEQPNTLATSTTSLYSIPGFAPSSASSTAGVFATSVVSPSPFDSPALSASSSLVESSAPSAASGASSSSATSIGSSSAGLTVSEDGECSGVHTCAGSIHGPCCSQWGWCGSTDAYCGAGCMEGFGQCGTFLNSTSSTASVPTGAKFRMRT